MSSLVNYIKLHFLGIHDSKLIIFRLGTVHPKDDDEEVTLGFGK